MKMKYLVPCALCLVLGASTAWAVPTVKDRSIVGHWKFDDPKDYGKDTSGYGGTSFSFTSGQMSGNASGSGAEWTGASGTGYLTIAKKSSGAYSASTTLGGENSINGTSGYQTVAAWFRADCSVSIPFYINPEQIVKNVIDDINDHVWHFGAMRYHKNAAPNSTTSWMVTTDPADWSGDASSTTRNEASENNKCKFPVVVSGSTVSIGGNIGPSTASTGFYGDIDEAMVINRMLCKNELTRLYRTGEAYIWSSGTPSFDKIDGWSITMDGTTTKEGTSIATLLTWVPGVIKQTTYLIDNDKTMTYGSGAAAYFGQSADNKVALAVGRAEVLKNRLTGADMISGDNLKGGISITSANTALSFWDLRLNKGQITANANNQSVTADMLDVEGEPFNMSVPANCEFTFNAGGKVTGDGVLAKTGDGTLILNNYAKGADRSGFVDAPKVRLTAGFIKTPKLDGYTGGTVIVDGDAVTFTGADTLSGTIQVRYDGTIAAAEATYPVLNAPTLTSASQVKVTATYPEKYEGVPKLENGVVSLVVTKKVAPIPDEDKGAKPVLLWQ